MRCTGLAGSCFDLLSQSLDVGVKRARVGELKSPPKCVEADLSRHDLTQSGCEERQEIELLAAEFDLDAQSSDGSTNEIDAQVTERDDLFVRVGERSAQDRTDACDQFSKSEGLGDVIGGADLESEHHVDLTRSRGDHDHGRARRVVELAAVIDTRTIGQHNVEKNEVRLCRRHQLTSLGDVRGADDHETFDGETDVESVLIALLIFDDEDDASAFTLGHGEPLVTRG